MRQDEQGVRYEPRLPSANAFDYYYKLKIPLRQMPFDSRGLPLTPREVEWLKRNQSVFRTLAQALDKRYWLPEPFRQASDVSYFADFRRVARAVSLQIRWHLSENDGSDAVSDWRAGFKMARDLYGDSLLNTMVGHALEMLINAAIAPAVRRFLSAREAREMAQTLIDSESKPDRVATLAEGELHIAMQTLQQLLTENLMETRRDLLRLLDESIAETSEQDSAERETLQRLRRDIEREFQSYTQNPAAYHLLRREAESLVRRLLTQAIEGFALRQGKFHPVPIQSLSTGSPILDYLVDYSLNLPFFGKVSQVYWESRARRRLLAWHCLLREYHLRELRYPDTLEQLRLGDWATDPFSGKLPIYRREGDSYTLYSVGVVGKDLGGYRRQPGAPPDTPENLFVLRGAHAEL